jgi:AcrR family transcriptional regulator
MAMQRQAAGAEPRSKRGEQSATVGRILAAARRVLVQEGYAGFSMRRVAAALGMSVGNLTYHFPSKSQLLRALIQDTLDDYRALFEEYRKQVGGDPEASLRGLLGYLMRDSASESTSKLFRELWALAAHDAGIAAEMDAFYDAAIDAVIDDLGLNRHPATRAAPRAFALLATLISEGTVVLFGTRRDAQPLLDDVRELAVRALLGALQFDDGKHLDVEDEP